MEFLIGSEYSRKLVEILQNAKCSVEVLMYHWRVSRGKSKPRVSAVEKEISDALARGVKVRVILNHGLPSDPIRKTNSTAAGWLRSKGAEVRFWGTGRTMHSKLFLVDRTFLVSGSHNFSESAMTKNIEISAFVVGSGDIRKVQDYFNLLWRQV